MDNADLLGWLQELGFTEYQARTYVAAVELGMAEAKDLSSASGVPQSRIYDVIADLRGTGLVEVREESGAKTIIAASPARSLEALKDRRITRLDETIDSLAAGLEQLHQPVEHPASFVTMVELRETALRHMHRAIETAEWWLSLALPFDLYRDVEEDIESALDRGVTVRLVLPDEGDPPIGAVSFPDGLAVRQRLLADVLVVADRRYGVFSSLTVGADSRPYVIMQDEHLVFLLQNFFDHFWPVSTERRALGGFPRRYLDPWRAIKDLKPALDDGTRFEVSVTGFHNHRRENGTWDGRIVDYELTGPVEADYTIGLPTKANLFVDIEGEVLGVGGRRAAQMDIAAEGLVAHGPTE